MQPLNFHKDKNFFMDWLLFNEMATGEIVLWHTLMNIGNRLGQRSVFNVPTSTMEIFTGLSNASILDARKKLKERGFIKYGVGKMNRPPVYEMLPIHQTLKNYTLPEAKENREEIESTKQERRNPIYQAFEENVGKLTPIVQKELTAWTDTLEDVVILEAIRLTAMNGGKTFAYLNKILEEWHQAKLTTLEHIEAHQLAKTVDKEKKLIPLQKQTKKQSLEIELDELLEEDF